MIKLKPLPVLLNPFMINIIEALNYYEQLKYN